MNTDPGGAVDTLLGWAPADRDKQQAARDDILRRLPDPDDILAMLGLDEGAPRW